MLGCKYSYLKGRVGWNQNQIKFSMKISAIIYIYFWAQMMARNSKTDCYTNDAAQNNIFLVQTDITWSKMCKGAICNPRKIILTYWVSGIFFTEIMGMMLGVERLIKQMLIEIMVKKMFY